MSHDSAVRNARWDDREEKKEDEKKIEHGLEWKQQWHKRNPGKGTTFFLPKATGKELDAILVTLS